MQEKSPHVTSVLPAVAPFTDKEFANALEISVERFRDWVLLYSLRGVKKMGTRVIIVDAEEFYASMPDFTQENPQEVSAEETKVMTPGRNRLLRKRTTERPSAIEANRRGSCSFNATLNPESEMKTWSDIAERAESKRKSERAGNTAGPFR